MVRKKLYSHSFNWKESLSRSGGLNNTSLYMLNTATEQTLSIGGTRTTIDTMHIQVKGNRWSFISYLPQINMTAEEALADYTATDQDVIKSQTGFHHVQFQKWLGRQSYVSGAG